MYYLTDNSRQHTMTDDEDEEYAFATVDAAITKARELSKSSGLPIIYVFDGLPTNRNRPKVRAWAGRAMWLTRCTVCKGSGYGKTLSGWGGPPMCTTCSGSGYAEDLECAR